MQFLQLCHEEAEAFVQWIVTGDETWGYCYELASKCQSMEWKHIITQVREIQKCAFCQQSDVDTLLGLNRAILSQ
jgi:hypothetical protein